MHDGILFIVNRVTKFITNLIVYYIQKLSLHLKGSLLGPHGCNPNGVFLKLECEEKGN